MSDAAIGSIERSLLALRRRQRRLALAGKAPAAAIQAFEVADVVSDRSQETTVADVAAALGVDPSQGSRRVAAAVSAGLVARAASQADGRRSLLALTPAGVEALAEVRARRAAMVGRATLDWPSADREALAVLLDRLVQDLAAPGPVD